MYFLGFVAVLSESYVEILRRTGFQVVRQALVDCVWVYHDAIHCKLLGREEVDGDFLSQDRIAFVLLYPTL